MLRKPALILGELWTFSGTLARHVLRIDNVSAQLGIIE